jgi:hypothetical protein
MAKFGRAIITTRSGRHVDLLAPAEMVSLIDIDDIAYALSKINRFNGHTTRLYSVAEHCLNGVAYCLPQHKLEFLLHDATEAYLGDAVGPIKGSHVFTEYRKLESSWWAAIAGRYGVRFELPKEIHEVDKRMLVTEQRDLMMGRAPSSRDPFLPFSGILSPVAQHCDEIAQRFLAKFYELTRITVGAKR